ncbi:Eukaryotic translation initiation factor 3 subunit F [Mycena indigotica]|uniref:Eukaryotic translation initiation factor 3 subunit F n=1 Tax=Mycena indigotica TaxID=2126181 RepID=A0A8H6SQ65_9AGAR|nr:Eukaryotic translation initiation factor 3 subunit F [Mycena indigotica]KAF7301960.1 Eukaryotic translation initiation factor 3 subunit F [Mycena indigotica]
MALGGSSAVHVQTSTVSAPTLPRQPSNVTVHPAALFSILDHYLRRSDEQPRVIGTLLGTRSPDGTVVHVRSSFAVLHSETDEQVAVDMEYHRTMYELHTRVTPKETIVGWYSTGSNLNTYSALIQNFYSQETAPQQAIHVALNTGAEEDTEAGVHAFVSSPVGVFPKPENCIFTPVPVRLKFDEAERSGLDLLSQTSTSPNSTSPQPVTTLANLDAALTSVSQMIDRVLVYVRRVLAGEIPGDKALGRYLMDTLAISAVGEKGSEDKAFNAALQDTLMISYLANLLRSQAEVSSRLALVA